MVASFTDAWIETPDASRINFAKLVASFTDAWIETGHKIMAMALDRSHLLQMRGLKPEPDKTVKLPFPSHLLQMRGLKQ